MLKIVKSQVQKGQKVKVDANMIVHKEKPGSSWYMMDSQVTLTPGTELTLDGKPNANGRIVFTDGNSNYSAFWQEFKKTTSVAEGAENLGEDNKEYVIFYDGKKHKAKKYSDIGKVKASLLVMMSYHDKFYKISRKFLNNCPELEYLQVPEWLSYGDNLSRKDFEKVEIFEWANRKLGNKVDFDPVAFYDEQMLLIKVSAQFGTSARELFKKVKDTHQYMLVFMHEDYQTQKYCNYEDLKESNVIKEALKKFKFKNTSKSTKLGKTVVAFDNASDVVKLSSYLPLDCKTFIVDMSGNELVRAEESLIRQEMRNEKLDALFA